MIEREALPPLSGDAIDRIKAFYQEPDWLEESRRAAWRRYEATPWPERTDERWRRTDLKKLDVHRIQPFQRLARVEAEFGFGEPEDGVQTWAHAREEMLASGVLLGTFEEIVRGNPELFEERLCRGMEGPNATDTRLLEGGIPADADKFEILTRAVGADGYAVYVPRGVDVAVPLRATVVAIEEHLPEGVNEPSSLAANLNASLEAINAATTVMPRSVIIAEPHSRVTVIEEFRPEQGIGPFLSAGLTEIFVGEGAEVTIVSLQDWSDDTWNFHTQRSHVAQNGRIVTLSINLGGKVTKMNVEGVLVGEDAQSRMLGVLFGEDRQHFDIYTLQDHQAHRTHSDLLFKHALRDESKSIYSGLIRVDEGVLNADAYQANRNLMLSGKAKADSRPMLEILNNEVRCTHGATMGPVDTEQLFYLQARGLPRPEAERMVVQGFFEEALDDVKDEATRTYLHDRIAAKIGALDSASTEEVLPVVGDLG